MSHLALSPYSILGEYRQFAMSIRIIEFCGFRWEVFETPAKPSKTRQQARAGSSSLYFLSRIGSRRTDAFPANWAGLSERELASLCATAQTIGENAAFTRRGDPTASLVTA